MRIVKTRPNASALTEWLARRDETDLNEPVQGAENAWLLFTAELTVGAEYDADAMGEAMRAAMVEHCAEGECLIFG